MKSKYGLALDEAATDMKDMLSPLTLAALPLAVCAGCSAGNAGAAERLDLCAYTIHFADCIVM